MTRFALMLSLVIAGCGGSVERNNSVAGRTPASFGWPASWHCYQYELPEGLQYFPCHPSLEECQGVRALAAQRATITSECTSQKVAYCIVRDTDGTIERWCHGSLGACAEFRRYDRARGTAVTSCQGVPP